MAVGKVPEEIIEVYIKQRCRGCEKFTCSDCFDECFNCNDKLCKLCLEYSWETGKHICSNCK
jgi:hypothetical protein